MSKEIILKKETSIITEAESKEIKSAEDMTQAVVLLSELNKANDRIVEEREKVTKPLNEALRAERARWKPAELKLTQAIELLRAKMSSYQTEQVRLQREQEQKIASRIAPGKGNLSIETAIKKIESIKTPEKEVPTDSGLVQFREVKRFEVVSLKDLPLEYHLPDESAISKAMKEGKELPGVRYFTEQVPVNYR